MAQPEDQIAIILEELRQDLTNTSTMLTIAIPSGAIARTCCSSCAPCWASSASISSRHCPPCRQRRVNDVADHPRSPAEADHGTPIPPS
jgi:hypothetical protein